MGATCRAPLEVDAGPAAYGILAKPRVSMSRSNEKAAAIDSRSMRTFVVQSVYEIPEDANRRNAASAAPSTSSDTWRTLSVGDDRTQLDTSRPTAIPAR